LAGGQLLAALLAACRATPELAAFDQSQGCEPALVRWTGHIGYRVRYRGSPTCKLLLEHRLRVDVLRQGVLDPAREGVHDRLGDPVDAAVDVRGADHGLGHGRKD